MGGITNVIRDCGSGARVDVEPKTAILSLSLRGDALRVLQAIPLQERQNLDELLTRLEMRFGNKHMERVYRSQLINRCQKPNETLQEFEFDIIRLIKSAYPSVSDDVYQSLAIDRFLEGLRELETQQAVNDALTQALEFEAVKKSVRSHARVRALEETEGGSSALSVEDIVQKVLAKLEKRGKEPRCWNCGKMGHLRNKCPRPQKKERPEN